MPSLGIDRSFLWEFGRLQRHVQDKVADVFGEFEQATHTGLHLEKISGARDPRLRSIRIDQFWRGVVLAPDGDDTFTLLRVLPHDDAYAWARRQRASVNRATGVIELRDVVAVAEELPATLPDPAPAPPLLAHVGDADLARLGIDNDVLALARRLTDTAQLERARDALPEAQYDVLLGLSVGLSPEEVWAEVAGPGVEPGGFDPDDLGAAVARSGRRIVMVDGPDELLDVFARPFAQWRVFLHPAQRRAAYASYRGPARVTGGPGTGKTVAALHRALHLARCSPVDRSVLLTTFTRTLTAALEDDLRVLVDDDDLLRRVDVRGLDQLAHGVVARASGRPQLLSPAEETAWWQELVTAGGLDVTPAFLGQEWRGVVLTQQIDRPEQYLRAPRAGRGRPLSAAQRGPIWAALRGFTERLERERRWTHETVSIEAARLLAARPTPPYRHVVVDEAQDLAPWQWQLLRAAVAPGPDDLFIAGDAHQRIYTHRVSLRALGIEVAGRSERLRISYRTTSEILNWSVGLLHGERVEGIDTDVETLAGCRSEVHGEPPVVQGAPDQAAELHALVGTVRGWLADDVAPEHVGVAARTTGTVRAVVDALVAGGVPAVRLGEREQRTGEVAVATMHRVKGLEFRCVAVAGVGAGQLPLASATVPASDDAATHRLDVQRERCLLFVACTRARERLAVSWHGEPSPFLIDIGVRRTLHTESAQSRPLE